MLLPHPSPLRVLRFFYDHFWQSKHLAKKGIVDENWMGRDNIMDDIQSGGHVHARAYPARDGQRECPCR